MGKDKKIKTESIKNTTYSGKEMKRYLGVLNEQNNENLKAIREGFQIVNRKLDEHSNILNEHSNILNEHSNILNEHTRILGTHSEMIGTLMEDVSVIKEDVSVLKDDMQIVKKELKKKVDYDEFLSLVQRVNKLEAKI